ncbi:NAD(P)-dependent oxidoreductase [Streptomyces sp. TP-A0874]|uniref:NAD(P)-dependent oxidoreductase n=1 Tax=Streptomyces sp. TP-A0874 TaxID=549819 RepID=UPI0008536C82|nr:NAD(P)-dependent oxidoreductase [Streptomyces sp. TP-A0874]
MTQNNTSVAVLGTGIMGAAMARNLCRAGMDVRVWNRTLARAEPLAADGARVADAPATAVEDADVVLTMLFDGPVTLETMRAAAPALRPGAAWLQSSTAGLQAVRQLAGFAAERGLAFFDAPVLGTRQPAESGELIVLAAGPQSARPTVAPVLETIGSRTVWTSDDGASGAASRLKLVCNSWVLALNNATAEALALAEGLGVEQRAFLDAVADGPLDCGYLRAKAATIRGGEYSPDFTVRTAAKDARLIVEAAEAAGVWLGLAEAGAERFRRATERGHGGQDMAASYFASFGGS